MLAENKPNEGPDDGILYVNITVEKLLELNDKHTKPLAGVTFGVYLADKDGQYVQMNGAQVKVASLTTGLNDEHADRAFGISTSIVMHELYAQYPDYVERLENGEYKAHFVLVEEKWPANVTPRALEYPLTVTTQRRIDESFVTPTLAATPGDLSLVMPKRILDGIIEMIYALDKIAPGTANDDTLLYGVEVKFYNMEVEIDNNLQTKSDGLYVIGDCSGVTHSLSHASASGVHVARHILAR